MLVVVSPAKRLDWSERQVDMTTPMFQKDANRLASHARQLTLAKLKRLMDLSDDLAKLNRDRFKTFADAPEAPAAGASQQCPLRRGYTLSVPVHAVPICAAAAARK